MNRLLFFFICILFFVTAKAQRNYQQAIDSGYFYYRKGDYKTAINKYFAAEAFDPTKKSVVKDSVSKAFEAIEALRAQAHTSDSITKITLVEIVKAKTETQTALGIANKHLNRYYFYKDRFALSVGVDPSDPSNYLYYFIDKNADIVERLHSWPEAGMFDEATGFAKVKKYENHKLRNYLLDTLGNTYASAYETENLTNDIKALDLSASRLDTFPSNVLNYPQLEILIFKTFYNNPNSIRIVDFLEDGGDTNSFPAKITGLRNLKHLHLANFQITSLPEQIEDLKNLVTLDLLGNKLKSLPKQIGELKNLRTLILGLNQLSDLPSEIDSLKNLTELYLNGNEFDRFPEIIMNLKKLKKLFLNENSFDKLPAQFADSNKNLTTLGLSQIEFNSWPSPVEKMKNLTELSLFDIHLKTLPDEIGDLKNLITLNLSENELTNLPIRIRELKNLRTLDLSYNELKSLPKQIGELNNLTTLYLDGNPLLSKLPREIGKLIKLKTLVLSGKNFSQAEIEKIKKHLPNCVIITD